MKAIGQKKIFFCIDGGKKIKHFVVLFKMIDFKINFLVI